MATPLPTWKALLVGQPRHPDWSRRPPWAGQDRAGHAGTKQRTGEAGLDACPTLASLSRENCAMTRRPTILGHPEDSGAGSACRSAGGMLQWEDVRREEPDFQFNSNFLHTPPS